MNRRRLRNAIDHREARRLRSAVHEAARQNRILNRFVTIHPGRLGLPPDDLGLFFRAAIKRIGNWFRRNCGGWWAIWVRENYEGDGREHLHLLIHVPRNRYRAFEAALLRWWPETGAVDFVSVNNPTDVVAYMLKQMTPQAQFALRRRVRRETRSRHDLAKVAPVLGSRTGMTGNLKRLTKMRGLKVWSAEATTCAPPPLGVRGAIR
jgi:hypothetical protein